MGQYYAWIQTWLLCTHLPLWHSFVQNSEAENLVLIEMLDANEDGEVDSFEWTTMLSQVSLRLDLVITTAHFLFLNAIVSILIFDSLVLL